MMNLLEAKVIKSHLTNITDGFTTRHIKILSNYLSKNIISENLKATQNGLNK